jgi:hypothetical protein
MISRACPLILALPFSWGGDTIAGQGDINMKSPLDND